MPNQRELTVGDPISVLDISGNENLKSFRQYFSFVVLLNSNMHTV